ncbi:HNH endonuclease [Azohydromonas australica]|uniref:HNH endonuclease n=1 Tax=Azohydromonas australica TaxID=364039 RepID=UPI001EE49AAE|nr:HNH endonuclease [Azohydromonas australica]
MYHLFCLNRGGAKAANMASGVRWTRQQVLAALHLYVQLPFGQLDSRHPRIRALATWMGRTPSAVAMKLVNLASLDPQITSTGRTGLAGSSALDKAVWSEFLTSCDETLHQAAEAFEHFAAGAGVDILQAEDLVPDDLGPEWEETNFGEGRSRPAWLSIRLDQARFRRAVLASYSGRCCMTGLDDPRLLNASHIVPWAVDHRNRLNPRNGLCLSALHDRAFDKGLITVMPGELVVRVSDSLRRHIKQGFGTEALLRYEGQRIHSPSKFKPDDAFLAWHARQHGFLKA